MIPQEIAQQITTLNERANAFSAKQRTLSNYEKRFEHDNIKSEVQKINILLTELITKTNNILVDSFVIELNIDDWFESQKDKTEFTELNPRIIYEEEKQQLDRQKKLENERTKKAIAERQRELERQKKLTEEKAKKELEAIKKRQYEEMITNFNYICKWGPNDIVKIQQFINEGLDITESSALCSVSTLIKQGRNSKFINFLIENGLIITESEKTELKLLEKTEIEQDDEILRLLKIGNKLREFTNFRYDSFYLFLLKSDLHEIKKFLNAGHVDLNRKVKSDNSDMTYTILSIFQTRGIDFVKMLIDIGYQVTKEELNFYFNGLNKNSHFKKIVEVLITSKNIEKNALKIFDHIKKEFELENQLELEQYLIAEFRFICLNGPDNIAQIQQLIKKGLDLSKTNVFYPISTLSNYGRSTEFIRFLLDAGMNFSNDEKQQLEKRELLEKELAIKKAKLEQDKLNDIKKLSQQEITNEVITKITNGKFNNLFKLFNEGNLEEVKVALSSGIIPLNVLIQKNASNEIISILKIVEKREIEFIKLLVNSGYLVTLKEIQFYQKPQVDNPNFRKIFKVLITAKNVDRDAKEFIKKLHVKRIIIILIWVIVLIGIIIFIYFFYEMILIAIVMFSILAAFVWGITHKR